MAKVATPMCSRCAMGSLSAAPSASAAGSRSDVEVIAGVNAGDVLVVSGPENLHDSEKVEVRTQ